MRIAAVGCVADHKFLVKLQLLGERLAQRVVVINDQDALAQGRRALPPSHRSISFTVNDVYSAAGWQW